MTKGQKSAMQLGRERAAKRRRKAAVKRVKDYRAWLAKDKQHWADFMRGYISAEQWNQRKPKIPELPSDYDYQVEREESQ